MSYLTHKGKMAEDTLEALRGRIDVLAGALLKIENPIKALQEEAEKEGYRLNGQMAVQISDDPEYLKGLARDALISTGYIIRTKR